MRNFDEIARQLVRSAGQPSSARISLLKQKCPEIVRQIELDAGMSGPLIFWGRSLNLDELAGLQIVDTAILEPIFELARHKLAPAYPHAGLQHTYGYLFSTIETPYGMKRDRWVMPGLENGLRLPHDVLSPAPEAGSLLANATWLAGQVAFQKHNRRNWLKRCLAGRISPALRAISIDRLAGFRYTESLTLPLAFGAHCRVSLMTDLIRLPEAMDINSRWLLVYSIEDSRSPHPQIITLFTVSDESVEVQKQRAATRRRNDIRPRYNAYIPGFPSEPQTGTVRMIQR